MSSDKAKLVLNVNLVFTTESGKHLYKNRCLVTSSIILPETLTYLLFLLWFALTPGNILTGASVKPDVLHLPQWKLHYIYTFSLFAEDGSKL